MIESKSGIECYRGVFFTNLMPNIRLVSKEFRPSTHDLLWEGVYYLSESCRIEFLLKVVEFAVAQFSLVKDSVRVVWVFPDKVK